MKISNADSDSTVYALWENEISTWKLFDEYSKNVCGSAIKCVETILIESHCSKVALNTKTGDFFSQNLVKKNSYIKKKKRITSSGWSWSQLTVMGVLDRVV